MSIPSIVELAGVFDNTEATFAIWLYMMFYRSPKFVPGKHATMITQVGISPSIITNWTISLKGLHREIIVKIVPGTDRGLLYYI